VGRGKRTQAEDILYGSFVTFRSDEDERELRRQKAGGKRASAKEAAIELQRQTPITKEQFKALCKSKANHPLLARRYGITPEQITGYKNIVESVKRVFPLESGYKQLLEDLYPPGTRVVFEQLRNPNSESRNLPGAPSAGQEGTIEEVDSIGTLRVRWDNGKSFVLASGDKFKCFPAE